MDWLPKSRSAGRILSSLIRYVIWHTLFGSDTNLSLFTYLHD